MVPNNRHVTFYICSSNRFESCHKIVSQLVYQSIKFNLQSFIKIVILENGSSSGISGKYRMLSKLSPKQIVVLNLKFSGLSYARNVALDIHKDKSYCYFLDDDVSLAKSDFLLQMHKLLSNSQPDIFGGPVNFVLKSKPASWFREEWISRVYDSEVSKEIRFSGGNFGISPSVIESQFKFDENLGMKGRKVRIGEEKDFIELLRIFRPNLSTLYSPDLSVLEVFDKRKLSLIYRIRREFAVGYAHHASYSSLVNKKIFVSFARIKPTNLKYAWEYSSKNFIPVKHSLSKTQNSNNIFILILTISRCIGLFLRKLRWQV